MINYFNYIDLREDKNMNPLYDFVTNKYIYIPVIVWFLIQTFKVFYDIIKTKKFNFKRIIGEGGMPSSHSDVVS